jgi:hypothetical protein
VLLVKYFEGIKGITVRLAWQADLRAVIEPSDFIRVAEFFSHIDSSDQKRVIIGQRCLSI